MKVMRGDVVVLWFPFSKENRADQIQADGELP